MKSMKLGDRDSRNLIIITKYFAPANVVDANSVYDLCEKLLYLDKQLNIHIVTTSFNYKSNIKLRNFDNSIIEKLNIIRIKQFYNLKYSGILRVFNDIYTGFFLVFRARRLKVNTIISLSNPPLINLWCSLLLWNRRYVYWSFDLYPEALFADKIISRNGFLGSCINWLTYLNSPNSIIALGPKQFEYLISCYSDMNINRVILPCGIHKCSPSEKIPEWYSDKRIILGYIGNLGKAHSKEFLINIIKVIPKYSRITLVVSIYGESSKEIISIINNSNFGENIKIIDSVNQNELGFIDIHLVSLLDNWTNVSVPSKAVSAICSKSALWFNGSKDSDTYNLFQKCIYYSGSDMDSVIDVLNKISQKDLQTKKIEAGVLAEQLHNLETNSIKQIYNLIF